MVSEGRIQDREILENNLILVGFPERTHLLSGLPEEVEIRKDGFTLNGSHYNQPSDVFFGVFPHPSAEGRVMGLFLPNSMNFAHEIARKATHYGKYSYLAFRDGRNLDKGIWPISGSPLTYHW